MWARSIFTAFILSVITVQAWAQTVQGTRPVPLGSSPTFGADNGVVPAAATSPSPLAPNTPAFTAPVPGGAGRQPVPCSAARRSTPCRCT